MQEVRWHNDVRLIHDKGHSAHAHPGNDIADELAWSGNGGRRSTGSGWEEEKGYISTIFLKVICTLEPR